MRVRVVQKCSLPLEDGGRPKYMTPERTPEVEWNGSGALPYSFEPCDREDLIPVAEKRLEFAKQRLEAVRHKKDSDALISSRTRAVREAEAELEAALEVQDSTGSILVAEVPPPPAAAPSLKALDKDGQVIDALNQMDHAADEQWTSQGLPRIEAVSRILEARGFDPAVTRAEINVARPGFVRET